MRALKFSRAIWVGLKGEIFRTIQPKVNMTKLEKNDKRFKEEGSTEKKNKINVTNLRKIYNRK
jgi:hypothetical protein